MPAHLKVKSDTEKIGMKKANLIADEIKGYDAAVLTGGSSGIGEAFLRKLIEFSNVKICNMSRNAPDFPLDKRNFLHVPCNLQKKDEICEAVGRVFDFIGIDEHSIGSGKAAMPRVLLINNAGFGCYGEFPSPSAERNCDMLDLNVRALTYLCARFMPVVKSGRGSIVNISSTAAWQACPQLAAYGASKAYVMSFSLAISEEMRRYSAKCLCVCPGPTSSNFFKAAGFDSPPLPSGFGHKPEDVVNASFEALAKGKNLIVVGFVNKLQTAAAKLLPTRLVLRVSGAILSRIRRVD